MIVIPSAFQFYSSSNLNQVKRSLSSEVCNSAQCYCYDSGVSFSFPGHFCQNSEIRVVAQKGVGKGKRGRGPTCQPPFRATPVAGFLLPSRLRQNVERLARATPQPQPPLSVNQQPPPPSPDVRHHQHIPSGRRRRMGGDQVCELRIRRTPIHVSNAEPPGVPRLARCSRCPAHASLGSLTCSRSTQIGDAVRQEHASRLQDRRRARRPPRHRRAQRPLALPGRWLRVF